MEYSQYHGRAIYSIGTNSSTAIGASFCGIAWSSTSISRVLFLIEIADLSKKNWLDLWSQNVRPKQHSRWEISLHILHKAQIQFCSICLLGILGKISIAIECTSSVVNWYMKWRRLKHLPGRQCTIVLKQIPWNIVLTWKQLMYTYITGIPFKWNDHDAVERFWVDIKCCRRSWPIQCTYQFC